MTITSLAPNKILSAVQKFFRAHPNLQATVHIEANLAPEKMVFVGGTNPATMALDGFDLLPPRDPDVVRRNDEMLKRLTTTLTEILKAKPHFLTATGGFVTEATYAQVQSIAALEDVRCVDLSGTQKP